ncbi:unnamed protein product, partial [Rotaria magnacalcarata]
MNSCYVIEAERVANITIEQKPKGPPTFIQPKPQLTRAERRATQ